MGRGMCRVTHWVPYWVHSWRPLLIVWYIELLISSYSKFYWWLKILFLKPFYPQGISSGSRPWTQFPCLLLSKAACPIAVCHAILSFICSGLCWSCWVCAWQTRAWELFQPSLCHELSSASRQPVVGSNDSCCEQVFARYASNHRKCAEVVLIHKSSSHFFVTTKYVMSAF